MTKNKKYGKAFKFKAKPFINKRNNQMSITIPKRKLKKAGSNLKFDKDLFVELRVIKNGKRKK